MKGFIPSLGKFVNLIFDPKDNLYKSEGTAFDDTSISYIAEPSEEKWVKCVHCGAVLPDTPAERAAHAEETGTPARCRACTYMHTSTVGDETITYEEEEGKRFRLSKIEVQDICRYHHTNHQVGSDNAWKACAFKACRDENYEPVENFHMTHPGAFKKAATVSALDPNTWTMYGRFDYNGLVYKASGRYPIYACVYNNGLIAHFFIEANKAKQEFSYDPANDKIWWHNTDVFARYYEENYAVSDGAKAKIKKLMKEIYA